MACINSSPGNSYERFDGGLERTNRNKAYELGRQVLILEIEEWGRSDDPENSDTQELDHGRSAHCFEKICMDVTILVYNSKSRPNARLRRE